MSEIRVWEMDVASSCSPSNCIPDLVARDNTMDVEVIQTMLRKEMLTDLQNLSIKV